MKSSARFVQTMLLFSPAKKQSEDKKSDINEVDMKPHIDLNILNLSNLSSVMKFKPERPKGLLSIDLDHTLYNPDKTDEIQAGEGIVDYQYLFPSEMACIIKNALAQRWIVIINTARTTPDEPGSVFTAEDIVNTFTKRYLKNGERIRNIHYTDGADKDFVIAAYHKKYPTLNMGNTVHVDDVPEWCKKYPTIQANNSGSHIKALTKLFNCLIENQKKAKAASAMDCSP